MENILQVVVKMPIGTSGQTFEFQPETKDGFVSLTDLWKKYGSIPNKDPRYWSRQGGKEFIESLAKKLNVMKNHIYKTTRGGAGGTWAHWQIALSYLNYLSPESQMEANQIVKERWEEEQNPELAFDRGHQRAVNGYKKQGKDDKWIQKRLEGKVFRNNFTHELAQRGVEQYGFARCTDAIYTKVLGGTAQQLKQRRELAQKANLRDHLDLTEVAAVGFAEVLAQSKMDQNQAYGNTECQDACLQAGKATRTAIDSILGR